MSKKEILVFALTVALLITVQTVRAYTLAPDFSFTDTAGQKHTLSSFRGKVVVLTFFSVSCPVCRAEMTQLKTAYHTFPTNLVMISIGMDTDDTPSAVKAYKTKYAIPWIMAGNPSAPRAHSAIYALYNGKFCGSGLPQIYIIDRAGYIRYCHRGSPTSSTLITEIRALISSTTSMITVTSPNGGESWVRGTTHAITWTWTGSVGANVKIEVLKSGVVKGSVTTANDGSYSWTIAPWHLGTDYKIRITSTTYSSISDSSNGNFSITT